MKNKHVGYLVMGIALLFFAVVMSFNSALQEIVDTTCTHGTMCPMHTTLRTQEVISYGLMGLLLMVGLFMVFFMKEEEEKIIREERIIQVAGSNSNHSEEEKKKRLESLDEEEKKIMGLVLGREGSIYQSDLIRETKLSKVKITRILDRLEGKGLIERKRRGMTNIILEK